MSASTPGPDRPTLPAGNLDDFGFRTAEAEPMAIEDIRDALVIRENGLFLLMDKNGAVPAGNESGFGLYYRDTRFLSGYTVSLSGVQPVTLMAQVEQGYMAEQVLTNPAMRTVDGQQIRRETVEIRRSRGVQGTLTETLTLTNFNTLPVTLDVVYRFAADFADIFEVRGQQRAARGALDPPRVEDGALWFGYVGRDGLRMETRISFSRPPSALAPAEAAFRFALAHREPVALTITITPSLAGRVPASAARSLPLARDYEHWKETATRITTDNELFNAVLDRCISDLRALWTVNEESGESYIAAGAPWFDTLFGRDSIVTSFETLALRPKIARSTLTALTRRQGTIADPYRDETPGKILHEVRQGEMARTGESPFGRYYGSIDATPLYLMLAAEYWLWSGDRRFLRALQPALAAALRWCETHGDPDGDGYLEYERRSEGGLINQGWKDSGDAITAHDGRLANPPIALVEVQSYLYAARTGLARLAEDQGDATTAAQLRAKAANVQERFDHDFWMERGTYALALDGGKAPVDAISSNPGHALWCGIVPRNRARQVADRLMSGDMFSGWGVRTLSALEPRFNPLGYHLGTVWPHDNALIAAGLKRYGFETELNRLATGLFEVAQRFDDFRLPELFCGMDRVPGGAPVPYPVACRPQAWAAAALPAVLTAILGLRPDAPHDKLYVIAPRLPAWLTRVEVHGLRVGRHSVDLLYEQHQRRTQVAVLSASGPIEVVMANRWPEPAPGAR